MRGLSRVWFVSSNKHKFAEASHILERAGITLSYHEASLPEMQSDSLREIAMLKAASALDLSAGPVLVEDDGLFIDSLNGFPGPYSSYVFDTIGNEGILGLVRGDRAASFCSVVAYADGSQTLSFEGVVGGRISDGMSGTGWGYDPIFVPNGAEETFAQIDKDRFSHRAVALKSFARWYNHR